MNIKKLLCLLTAAVLALSLTACSKGGFSDKLDEVVNGGGSDTGDTGDTGDGGNTGDTGDTGDDGDTGSGGGSGFVLDYARYSEGLDERGFFEGVTARDIVTLPDYTGTDMPTEADEEEVRELILSALQSNADPIEVRDRPVVDGDTLNIDYVGSVDGVEFDGGSTGGNGTTVTIGVTSYIDDFLEQLIGHTPGENFNIEVTFPENYGVDNLNGKDAVFNITINYICEWQITDESYADLGFETDEDMWAAAREQVLGDAQAEVLNELLSRATCDDIPQSVLDTVHTMNLLYFADQVQMYYGMTLDQYVSAVGYQSVEEFGEELREDDRVMALRLLAAQAIAEAEGLEVTVEDIAELGYESSIEVYGEPYVRLSILNSVKLPEFLAGAQD